MRANKNTKPDANALPPLPVPDSSIYDVEMGGGFPPRITIQNGGGFKIKTEKGEQTLDTVSGVILAHTEARTYYAGAIDAAGGGQPPDCSAFGSAAGSGTPGGDCSTCPERPGTGKCKTRRPVFILRNPAVGPEVLDLSWSSGLEFQTYMKRLQQEGVNPYSVETVWKTQGKQSKGRGFTVAIPSKGKPIAPALQRALGGLVTQAKGFIASQARRAITERAVSDDDGA